MDGCEREPQVRAARHPGPGVGDKKRPDGESHVVAGTRKYVPTLGRVLRYLGKVVRFI
jgi:hypothetical protein